jgi:hypothetical protein
MDEKGVWGSVVAKLIVAAVVAVPGLIWAAFAGWFSGPPAPTPRPTVIVVPPPIQLPPPSKPPASKPAPPMPNPEEDSWNTTVWRKIWPP